MLEIRNYSQLNGLNVPEACMVPVSSSSDVFELMKIGQKNRAVGATALNDRSSRSHSVLTVHVQGIDLESGSVIRGCLHLVDLAGSERVAKSEATGDRLKEAQHINKSLSALGDVVSALAQKNVHVPYRNSKLTQLLQDSLGGQAKTLMFVHINPDVESYGETISTLKFAERVASVELGAARSNKESRDVWDLKEQVSFLKEVIAKKDVDISRLQSINTVAIESGSGFERSKLRLLNNFSSGRNTAEVNQRLRRQTVDASHKEKQGAFQVLENVQSQDFEASLVLTSPTRSRPPLEEDMECMKSVTIIRMDGSEASDGSEVKTTDALLTTSMKNQESTNDHGMLSREWHGRLHSSSESSLFGIASVDDLSCAWDLVHAGKCCELMNVSPLAGALKDSDISLNSLNLSTSSSLEGAVQIKLETSDDSMQEKEPDISGGLSDGNVSQADTEGSLSSMGEEIVWTKKTDIKGGKATVCHRKSSVSQLANSLRGTSLNSDSAITYPRRHSAAGSPWGSEWLSKHSRQKPPLFELKHGGQDRVVSGSEAGTSQSSQHMMKPPRRRF